MKWLVDTEQILLNTENIKTRGNKMTKIFTRRT